MSDRPSNPDKPKASGSTSRELPLVALRETVIFPEMIVPLQVGREKSVSALNAAVESGGPIALVTQRRPEQEDIEDPSELYSIGTLAKIAQVVQLQDGTVRAIVQGQGRLRVSGFAQTSPYIVAVVDELADEAPGGVEVQALMRTVQAGDRAVRRQRRPGPARGGRGRAQHHRARAAGRHGRLQPGHVRRAAPGAARDDRRRRAAQAGPDVPRPPGRDPRAQGSDPVRGQVRDGQDPARVHPARAAQGDPARARRGRPAAGRDQRAPRQGRERRDARRDQGPGDQGDRPDEPDPVRLARGRRHPDVRRLARRAALERLDRRPARHQGGGQDPRRGPLRPREDQGAHPRVPRGARAGGHDPQPHPRPGRPARRGQDLARQERRPGDGPQVRPDEPRRHPRRGRDPRPPADLHRGAARPDHPEHQDRRHEQPGVHARRDRQDRDGLPGRPELGPARGPRPGAEQHVPGQLPRGPVRPQQGPVHRHRQPDRPDPGRPARPDGDHPAARLHPAGEGRDRPPVPHPQADGEPRPEGRSTSRSPTRR